MIGSSHSAAVLARITTGLVLFALPLATPLRAQEPETIEETGADLGVVAREAEFYAVDHLVPPEGVVLEVGGMDFLSDGRLVLSTRRGQVWLVDDPLARDPADAHFSLFAEGLDEGLGLKVMSERGPDGRATDVIYVMQRGELSRLHDTDGDDVCDLIETVADDWGISGNYHEFGYGLPVDEQGNFYISLNVGFGSPKWWHGNSPVPYRGWVLRVTPSGEVQPVSFGSRSPAGMGHNAEGDLFVTDNQGDWMPACPIFHVQEGAFFGHPASLAWTEDYLVHGAKPSDTLPSKQPRAPAAIWLPYKWSRSAGNLVPDMAEGAFGPFGEQMFVAELTNGMVLRAQMEKVRGQWQGAVFLFRQNIGSSVRVTFAPDGTLFAGLTNRGWGGLPPADGIARLRWTGKVPMEMHTVHLLQDGFEITFTQPVAAGVTIEPDDVTLTQYDYDWWWEYGSPERNTAAVDVTKTTLSEDRRVLTVRTAGLTPAMVARLILSGVEGEDGAPLLHDEFAYTINQLPEGPLTTELVAKEAVPPPPRENQDEGWLRLTYGDALDAWESKGWSLVDAQMDPAEPTAFKISEGNSALVNVGDVKPTDFVGRYPLGDGKAHVEFMLPEGGASAVYLQGRYGIRIVDEAHPRHGETFRTGALMATGDSPARAPTLEAYKGSGQWHEMDIEFQAARFDAAGRKLENARLLRVTIDDILLHENVELAGPSPGAPLRIEGPLGPLAIAGDLGQVALRTLRFRASNEPDGREGWVAIFNGDDIDGWRPSPDAPVPGPDDDEDEPPGWSVDEGVLIGRGARSHLFSPRGDYTDLEFRAKVRINDGGNSGMYFRVAYGEGWPAGYEAQVNSSFTDPQRNGSIYSLSPVLVSLIPSGVWFEQHVICREVPGGTQITVKLNGVVVSEYLDKERRHKRGHVALQQHHDGSEVEYRDIEVLDLTQGR
jgi:glucose/arabinose dehydrogenase